MKGVGLSRVDQTPKSFFKMQKMASMTSKFDTTTHVEMHLLEIKSSR